MIGSNTTRMPWVQVPAVGLTDALKGFVWQKPDKGSAARETAALMIYVALLFVCRKEEYETPHLGELVLTRHVAELTYDELEQATGLSRSLIRQGIQRLEASQLVTAIGSQQKRAYILRWNTGYWFKLPCRAMVNQNGIPAFKTFTLRSKHELNALKIYLYLASIRDGLNLYSEASYEAINKKTNIPERDIRKALNILTTSGIMARINRESDRSASSWGPNQYFLTGYADLANKPST